jgi:hypothetical protein
MRATLPTPRVPWVFHHYHAQNRGWRFDRESRRSSHPRNNGWRSDRPPRQSNHPWNRGYWSDCHPRWSDRSTIHGSCIAYFVVFNRAPCSTHDSTHATRGPDIHESGCATHDTGVPALPTALLMSPSGCAGATGTASTSAVAAGEGHTDGTSDQHSSDDHTSEVELPAAGRQTHPIIHLNANLVIGALLHPCHSH